MQLRREIRFSTPNNLKISIIKISKIWKRWRVVFVTCETRKIGMKIKKDIRLFVIQSPEGWRVMISELIGLRLAFPVYLTSFKLRSTRIVPRCHFYKRTGHDVQSQQREWTSHW